MEFFQKNKKIFLFVGILALLVVGYGLIFGGGSGAPQSSPTDPTARGLVSELSASPADAIIGQKLLTTLLQIKSIHLDTTFFGDPVYKSLVDRSRPIDPQPFGKSLGRNNPFSDFGRVTPPAAPSAGVQAPKAGATGGSKAPKQESAEDFSF